MALYSFIFNLFRMIRDNLPILLALKAQVHRPNHLWQGKMNDGGSKTRHDTVTTNITLNNNVQEICLVI
jgi:hypothetical protein